MYEYDIRVGFSQCDVNTKLSITALIDIFQDCTTFQSHDLGVGFERLEKDHLAWVINYWELDIEDMPKLCDRVTVGTKPYEFKGFLGYRNFSMKNDNGQYLVKANSLWSLMNMQEMKPVKAPDFIRDAYTIEEKLDMEYGSRKVQIPDEAVISKMEPVVVMLHHLDGNHHMNNGQYIKIAMSQIDGDIDIKRLRTDYRQQAMLGDSIYPVVYRNENVWVVALNDAEGKPFSVTEITTR